MVRSLEAGTGMGSMHIHYPAITTIGGTMSSETKGRTDGWTAKFDAILQYGTIVGSFFFLFWNQQCFMVVPPVLCLGSIIGNGLSSLELGLGLVWFAVVVCLLFQGA